MSRQGFSGEIQWIVVDDGEVPTRCTLGQTVLRPRPFWQKGQNTHGRNLLAAVPLVRFSKILFIEDDDWYPASYVETMAARLEEATLVGEPLFRVYNVRSGRWSIGKNPTAALCQTGMRPEALPVPQIWRGEHAAATEWRVQAQIDFNLWFSIKDQKFFPSASASMVGIKGLPGRLGQTDAHLHCALAYQDDPDFTVLRSWIGSDVDLYRRFRE